MAKYKIWCLDNDETLEDARAVEANTLSEAVEKWARIEDSESGKYYIVNSESVDIMVIDHNNNEMKMKVFGEMRLEYSSSIVGRRPAVPKRNP